MLRRFIYKNYYEQPVEDGVVMMREKAPDTIV